MFSPGIASLIENASPFIGSNFSEDPQKRLERCRDAKIFVVGAGGLGCEILKCLAFNGFKHIDIIDLDKIEVSNLNRQFLFRPKDVGRYKSEVAAEYISKRVKGRFEGDIDIKYHTCRIQDFNEDFYKQFDIVIGGLDNVEARLWMSSQLVLIAKKYNKIIPYIDGGTSIWKGSVKVIHPSLTACMQCQADLFSREETFFAQCTVVSTPRKPEHCVYYAYHELWPNERSEKFDSDNDEHIRWVSEEAIKHANNFNLSFTDKITDKFSRKVAKNTMPAIASTQAIVASMCCTEAFKIITDCAPFLCNKINQDISGFHTNNLSIEGNSNWCGVYFEFYYMAKRDNCIACSGKELLKYYKDETIADLMQRVIKEGLLPNIKKIFHGKTMIYVPTLQPKTKLNLTKKVSDLEINVGDILTLGSRVDDDDKRTDFILVK